MTRVNRNKVASHRAAGGSNRPQPEVAKRSKPKAERFPDSFEPAPSAKKHAGKFHNNHRGGRIELRATTPIPPELNPATAYSPVETAATPTSTATTPMPSFTVSSRYGGTR